MPQLHRLPPEILSLICLSLDAQFFRQDVSRLHVAKWWYRLAQPVLHQDLDLSPDSLSRFVAACSHQTGLIDSIQKHARSVRLVVRGFDYRNDSTESAIDNPDSPAVDMGSVDAWTFELNENMETLAGIVQACKALQSLKLDARPEFHAPELELELERRHYLLRRPVASLLSVGHLTSLEVDTAGTDLLRERDGSDFHVCEYISNLLPRLRKLRCRLTRICSLVLGRAHCIDDENGSYIISLEVAPTSPLECLEDVVINMSISDPTGADTSYRYPSRCQDTIYDSFSDLERHMEKTAQDLVLRMSNPRVVRLITHTFPGLELLSFDAMTGRRMKLAPDAPWDADGEEIEEAAEDHDATDDLFDSDSDSDSDSSAFFASS